MKPIRKTIAVALFSVFAVAMCGWELYDFVVRDRGLEFYKEDWTRLLLPMGLGLLGGVAAWFFSRLPDLWRSRITLWGLGFFASATTCGWFFAQYFGLQHLGLLKKLQISASWRDIGPLVLMQFVLLVVSIYLWFAFYGFLKARKTKTND